MFRVEDLSKRVHTAEIQHLQSRGDVADGEYNTKVTSYFYPSLVFSNPVEITSITVLYNYSKSKTNDFKIKLAFQDSDSPIPHIKTEEDYILKHSPGKLVTTLKYPNPILIDINRAFYFFAEGDAGDSALTISYKNLN